MEIVGGARKKKRYAVERHEIDGWDDARVCNTIDAFISAHDDDYIVQAPSIIMESGKCWLLLMGTLRADVDREIVQSAKRNARSQVEVALETKRLVEAERGGVQPAHAGQVPQGGPPRGISGAFGKGR